MPSGPRSTVIVTLVPVLLPLLNGSDLYLPLISPCTLRSSLYKEKKKGGGGGGGGARGKGCFA